MTCGSVPNLKITSIFPLFVQVPTFPEIGLLESPWSWIIYVQSVTPAWHLLTSSQGIPGPGATNPSSERRKVKWYRSYRTNTLYCVKIKSPNLRLGRTWQLSSASASAAARLWRLDVRKSPLDESKSEWLAFSWNLEGGWQNFNLIFLVNARCVKYALQGGDYFGETLFKNTLARFAASTGCLEYPLVPFEHPLYSDQKRCEVDTTHLDEQFGLMRGDCRLPSQRCRDVAQNFVAIKCSRNEDFTFWSWSWWTQQLQHGDNCNIMACRNGCCCSSGPVNEDNARFLLLALFIVVYLLCGAAVFSALEQPKEREAKERWAQRFEHFSQKYNLSKKDLRNFLRNYEEANVAGIRVDTIRPRWDFSGAFYFVGTVVSTIGETEKHIQEN